MPPLVEHIDIMFDKRRYIVYNLFVQLWEIVQILIFKITRFKVIIILPILNF